MPKKQTTDDKEISLSSLKKHYAKIILAMILIFGFYIRFYHVDYPVVGYHNWKETKALTDARNFAKYGFFKDGLLIPRHDYTLNTIEPVTGIHPENFPATPALVSIFFKIFGNELWVARTVNILLSIGTVFIMYLFVKELFQREDMALVAGFLTALNPMYVFFSHNTDIINAAILFMVASGYFYVKWHRERKDKDLILATTFIMLAFITKQPHVILAVPMALTFPFRDYFTNFKKNLKLTAVCSCIAATLFGYLAYLGYVSMTVLKQPPAGLGEDYSDFSTIFKADFWNILKSYISDNFTLIGIAIAVVGLILMVALFVNHMKNFAYRFTLAYFIGFVFWFMVLSYKLSGHNYHQYPIAPLVIILMAFAFVVIASNTAKIASSLLGGGYENLLKAIAICAMIFVIYSPSIEARNRMFDTQFFGLDVAGEYIRQHSEPGEALIHSSHQSYGVIWHADRFGYRMPGTVDELKTLESKDSNWVFIYQWAIPQVLQNKELWTYMQENYDLVQFGFMVRGQQVQPMYFLLEKGGSFNESNLNQMLQSKPMQTKEYELTQGRVAMQYINLE